MEDQVIIFRSDFENFPPGLRFLPSDEELVLVYLKPKVDNQPQPPHRIWDVNVYGSDPYTLTEIYEPHGDEEWYFFTPLKRKYPKGNRVDRADQKGYWKQSGGEIEISHGGEAVGAKRALVYYKELPKHDNNEERQKMKDNSVKTEWLMQEYTLQKMKDIAKPAQQENTDMVLDPCVLCKIYKNVVQVEPLEEEPITEEVQVNGEINATINHNTSVHNSAQSSTQRMATYNQPESLPNNIPQTFNYMVDNHHHLSSQKPNMAVPGPANSTYQSNYGHLMTINPQLCSNLSFQKTRPQPLRGFDSCADQSYSYNSRSHLYLGEQLPNHPLVDVPPQPIPFLPSLAMEEHTTNPQHNPIIFSQLLAMEEYIINPQHNPIPFSPSLAMEEYTTNPEYNPIPFWPPLTIEERTTNSQHSSNPSSQELQPNLVDDPLQPLDPRSFFQQNTPPLPPVHDDIPDRQSFN